MNEPQKSPPKPQPEIVRPPAPPEGRPSEPLGVPPSPPELEPSTPLEAPGEQMPEIPTSTPFGGD